MAVSYGALGVRSFKAAVATTDTITPALPTGVGAGLLVVFASCLQTTGTFSSNNGLVKTRQNERVAILEKVVTNLLLESAPTITFGAAVVGDLLSAVCLWFPGGTSSKDWNDATGGAVTTMTPAVLTVTTASSVGIVFGHQPNDKTGASFTANSWTQQEYVTSTVGSDATYYIASQDSLSTGAKTMPSWSWTGTLEWRSISFSVPPAGGGSTTNQTVAIGAATAVALSRAMGVVRAVVAAGTVLVRKAVATTRSLGTVTAVAILASRAYLRTVVASASSSVAVVRTVGARRAVAAGTTATVARTVAYARTLAVTAAGSVSIRKAILIARGISAGTVTSLSASRAYLRTIAIGVVGGVSLRKVIGVTRATAATAGVSLQRAVGKRVAVASATITTALTGGVTHLLTVTLTIGSAVLALAAAVGASITPAVRGAIVPAENRLVSPTLAGRAVSVVRTARGAVASYVSRIVRPNRRGP